MHEHCSNTDIHKAKGVIIKCCQVEAVNGPKELFLFISLWMVVAKMSLAMVDLYT